MDATTPLRRWLRTAGLPLILAAGCHTDRYPGLKYSAERPAAQQPAVAQQPTVARPQAPADPLPLPPVPTSGPYTTTAASPATPTVIPGAGPVTGRAVPAGYTPGGAGILKPVVPHGIPSIKMVAIVGHGNIVTDQEIWEAVRQRPNEYLRPSEQGIIRDDAKEKAIYLEELRRIVERELILDEMYARLKKAGKLAAIEEIREFATKAADKQLRDFRKRYGAKSEQELQEKIFTPQGLTAPVIRRQIQRQMMADEYVRSMLKEKGKGAGLIEIRDYYETHADDFRTADKVKWLDIFISFNRFPTARAAYDYALAVQQQAAAGADFLALVKQHDHGLASGQNGEGIGTARGEIQPVDVEPTVWALQQGQVSGLVQTPTGYHIIKIAQREVAAVRPFDFKMQDEIRRTLMIRFHEREYKRLVEELWRKGVVKVLETPK